MLRPCTLLLALAALLPAQNCGTTSVGLTPLVDLGGASHQGFSGGLYPNGQNDVPPAHLALGQSAAAAVQPLDGAGQPSAQGRIVLLSVGMSNTTQEFSAWVPMSNADPSRNGAVTLVDGAQGGQTASQIANPTANFWNVVSARLAQAGVTENQVQIVWLKEANAGPTGGFPGAAITLRDQLRVICQILKSKYPNVRLCYLSSRIYAGYATTGLNPEPYAYESGFAVKWLVEEQIGGSAALNADPNVGAVLAPWIGWGPYLWADGLVPRSDGLTWACSDFAPDGTHPGPTGRQKVAAALDHHFTTHPTTITWYLGGSPPLPTAAASFYGQGCPTGSGSVAIVSLGLPTLGNPNYRVGIDGGTAGEFATLFISSQPASILLGGSCVALIDPSPSTLYLPIAGDPSTFRLNSMGRAVRQFAIPGDPAWAGVTVYAQWLVSDPQGALLGLYSLTRGMEIRIGVPSP